MPEESLSRGERNLLRFHKKNLSNPLENPDGSLTTVYVTGVIIGNQVYSVPGYDPEERRLLSSDEARDKWKDTIQDDPDIFPHHLEKFEGDIKDHPSNVWAREFHKVI